MRMWRACECGAGASWGRMYAPCSCVLLSLGISVHLLLCGGWGGCCVDTGVAKRSGQNVWLWVTFLRATLRQSCECSEAGVTL